MNTIDTNTIGWLFQLSTWQSAVALVFLVVSFSLIILWKKRSNRLAKFTNLFAIILGLLGGIIFFIISNYTGNDFSLLKPEDPIPPTWETEVLTWFNLMQGIFVALISFFVPFLIFSTIILVVTKRERDLSSKDFFVSVLSLIGVVAFGVLLAFAFYPLSKTIKYDGLAPASEGAIPNNLPSIFASWFPGSISIFTSPKFLISVVIMALIFGVIINKLNKEKNEAAISIIGFFEKLNLLFMRGISFCLLLIPFVIASKLPSLFLDIYGIQAKDYGIFIGIILAASAIILIIGTALMFLLTIKTNIKRHLISYQKNALITGFFSQSSASTLPYTIEAARNLTNNSRVASLTPTLGTSMGLIMCGGFFPTTVTLITAANTPLFVINASFFVILFFMAISVSIGVSGTPGTASITTTSLLQNNGLSLDIFTVMGLSLEPIIDPIRTAINIHAVLLATMITDKIVSIKVPEKFKAKFPRLFVKANVLDEETAIDDYHGTSEYSEEIMGIDLFENPENTGDFIQPNFGDTKPNIQQDFTIEENIEHFVLNDDIEKDDFLVDEDDLEISVW